MKPLNITLPPDVFKTILSGEKRMIATCRNARKDKYFSAKSPDAARINGQLFRITRISGAKTEWRVYIGRAI